MRKISVREFIRNTTKGLSQLPIVLTRYNIPIATISAYEDEDTEKEQDGGPRNLGFCQGHFEKGARYPLTTVVKENVSGDAEWVKNLCPKCIEREEMIVKNMGGRLIKHE